MAAALVSHKSKRKIGIFTAWIATRFLKLSLGFCPVRSSGPRYNRPALSSASPGRTAIDIALQMTREERASSRRHPHPANRGWTSRPETKRSFDVAGFVGRQPAVILEAPSPSGFDVAHEDVGPIPPGREIGDPGAAWRKLGAGKLRRCNNVSTGIGLESDMSKTFLAHNRVRWWPLNQNHPTRRPRQLLRIRIIFS